MTVYTKDKDKQEIDIKKRKSYNVPDLPEIKIAKAKRIRNKLPTSTISFPSEEFRLSITQTYKSLGYSTLKSYLLALIKLSMHDEHIKNKLKINLE